MRASREFIIPFTSLLLRNTELPAPLLYKAIQDNAVFSTGFLHGREYYDIDATTEEPQRATNLTVEEVLRQIAIPDAKTGHYRFGREAIEHLEEYLGALVGYLSGPLPVIVQQVEGEGNRL